MTNESPTRVRSFEVNAVGQGSDASILAMRVNPWWTVVATVASFVVGMGAISHYVLGIIAVAVGDETGWDRKTLSTGVAMFLSMAAISAIAVGALIDRIGPRYPTIGSVSLFVMCFLIASQAQSGLFFACMIAVAGLCYGAGTGLAYMKVIAIRFDKKRGLALGFATAGTGLGGMILAQYTGFLLTRMDWRSCMIVLAITFILISVSAATFALPRKNLLPAVRPESSEILPLRPVLLSRPFLLLASAVFIAHFATISMIVHGVRVMTGGGLSLQQAATTMSAVAAMSIVGRVSGGHLMDMFVAPYVSAAIFTFGAVLTSAVLFFPIPPVIVVSLILFGLVAGAEGDVMTYMTSRYFDNALFGRIMGILLFLGAMSGGLGIFVTEWLRVLDASFRLSLAVMVFLLVTAAIVVACIGRYRDRPNSLVLEVAAQ